LGVNFRQREVDVFRDALVYIANLAQRWVIIFRRRIDSGTESAVNKRVMPGSYKKIVKTPV
jgi:hypothetical protein